MLKSEYKYIAFDFETTGLDKIKDEPIQIWIVAFDENFKIIETYSSLIKPKKDIKELKTIVHHLTGFDIKQLEDAKSMEEILPDISKFFTKDTVIVWHNISFDLAFLQRYLEFTPAYQIDTYTVSRSLLHFLPSYALDVINEHLKKDTLHWQNEEDSEWDQYHDALYDSYLSYNLFQQLIKKLTTIRRKYLILDYMFQNSSSTLAQIIKRTPKPYKFENKELFFPALMSKKSTGNKKILKNYSLDIDTYSHLDNIDISNVECKEFIQSIDRQKGKYVIACTHPSKISIIEKLLKDMYIQTNTLHDQIIFDKERVNSFLHKDMFDDDEIYFALTYYSQFNQWHSLLDINSPWDYKVFSALSNHKNTKSSEVILCTHQQLFDMKHKISSEQTIIFMDKNRRYQSFSRVLHKKFDPLHLIQQCEQILYKYSLLKYSWEQFIHDFLEKTLFLHSTLSMEINQLFTWNDNQKIEVDDISNEARFPKSRHLIHSRYELFQERKSNLMKEDIALNQQVELFYGYITGASTISKRMYAWSNRYYQFQSTHTFVDRQDFIAWLPDSDKILFFSNTKRNHNDSRKVLTSWIDEVTPLHFLNLKTEPKIDKLVEVFQHSQENYYIVSSDKSKSKMLFDALVRSWVNKKYEVLAENITWWVWKNLYRWQQSTKPILLIWGYNYFLASVAKWIPFDTTFLYHLHGKLAPMIVQDLMWWRQKVTK